MSHSRIHLVFLSEKRVRVLEYIASAGQREGRRRSEILARFPGSDYDLNLLVGEGYVEKHYVVVTPPWASSEWSLERVRGDLVPYYRITVKGAAALEAERVFQKHIREAEEAYINQLVSPRELPPP